MSSAPMCIKCNQKTCDCFVCQNCYDLHQSYDMKETPKDGTWCEDCYDQVYIDCEECRCGVDRDIDAWVSVAFHYWFGRTFHQSDYCFSCFKDRFDNGLFETAKGNYLELYPCGSLEEEDLKDYQIYGEIYKDLDNYDSETDEDETEEDETKEE